MKLTIVEKNLLSWTAMHIDFVMCKNDTPIVKNAKKMDELFWTNLITKNLDRFTGGSLLIRS